MPKLPVAEAVPAARWGKDHWSMLAYIETCAVDKTGGTHASLRGTGIPSSVPMVAEIDKRRIRCNANTHPLHNVNANWSALGPKKGDPYPYGSMLKDGEIAPEHDDWDVMNDLEREGLIEVISEANAYIQLTDRGLEVSQQLRAHKAKGGQFYGFKYQAAAEVKA